jgi:Kef-type K+ transport system membrane component KefB
VLLNLLAALAAVVVVGRLLGRLFRAIGQPPVIGEVIAGILLGPSLLGHFAPGVYGFLLPAAVAPSLGLVAQLGVILYMFLVGLELNPDALRRRLRTTVVISNAGILVPFALGVALAFYLYPRFSTPEVPRTGFVLFIGVAMSVTAFPVLARILGDRAMTRTPLGELALTCAAVADVTAWCLLAFVVGVVQSSARSALLVAVLTLAFVAVLFVVVRPSAVRWARRFETDGPDRGAIALALVGALLAALATEAIGVHAIFGAFLAGAILPHDSRLARGLEQSLEHLVTILLLPAFFAFAGMRTEIGLVAGSAWLVCGLIVLVATAGKLGGTLLAARAVGIGWRDAAGLGVLMNTRGLMELIVLNVGLDLGVITPTLFTMLVLMALVTTMATAPALQVVLPGSAHAVRRQNSAVEP